MAIFCHEQGIVVGRLFLKDIIVWPRIHVRGSFENFTYLFSLELEFINIFLLPKSSYEPNDMCLKIRIIHRTSSGWLTRWKANHIFWKMMVAIREALIWSNWPTWWTWSFRMESLNANITEMCFPGILRYKHVLFTNTLDRITSVCLQLLSVVWVNWKCVFRNILWFSERNQMRLNLLKSKNCELIGLGIEHRIKFPNTKPFNRNRNRIEKQKQ